MQGRAGPARCRWAATRAAREEGGLHPECHARLTLRFFAPPHLCCSACRTATRRGSRAWTSAWAGCWASEQDSRYPATRLRCPNLASGASPRCPALHVCARTRPQLGPPACRPPVSSVHNCCTCTVVSYRDSTSIPCKPCPPVHAHSHHSACTCSAGW